MTGAYSSSASIRPLWFIFAFEKGSRKVPQAWYWGSVRFYTVGVLALRFNVRLLTAVCCIQENSWKIAFLGIAGLSAGFCLEGLLFKG